MRPIAVVTSCSIDGWDKYARRFVETFEKHWPADIPLLVVSEDREVESRIENIRSRARFHYLFESPEANRFIGRHSPSDRAKGRVMLPGDVGWTEKKRMHGYNFRLDAYRFGKKVFAIDLAARIVHGGLLLWVDADVVTFANVPRQFLEEQLPHDRALCCLDRGPGYHSECGFVGYNLDHDLGPAFIREFAKLYDSDAVFDLPEWHDSWVFDWLRRRLGTPTRAIPHKSKKQPFINSALGRYMDHMKGDSKYLGKSPSRFVVAHQDIPYWKE